MRARQNVARRHFHQAAHDIIGQSLVQPNVDELPRRKPVQAAVITARPEIAFLVRHDAPNGILRQAIGHRHGPGFPRRPLRNQPSHALRG